MIPLHPVLVETDGTVTKTTRTRHPFDYEEPLAAHRARCEQLWKLHRSRSLYIGPRAVVLCDRPTHEFWRAVYAEYGAWAYEARHHMGRRSLESPQHWYDPAQPRADEAHRKAHREACLTGTFFLRGAPIPYHAWPTRKEVGYRPKRARKKRR